MALDTRRVLPTKINLIRLRREYRMLRRIRGVMEEKREVILHYLTSAAEEYNQYQKEIFKALESLYTNYYLGVAAEGIGRVKAYSSSVPESLRVSVDTRVLFAVKTPVFRLDEKSVPPNPLPPGADPHLVASYDEIRRLMPSLLKLVEYEEMIRRLIRELRETQRLINALDYVILPSYEEAIKYIKMVLDERMREDFVRLKILKTKLESK